MTSQQNTGTHPFYIGMYIHIYTHIYVHKYTSQKECLHIFQSQAESIGYDILCNCCFSGSEMSSCMGMETKSVSFKDPMAKPQTLALHSIHPPHDFNQYDHDDLICFDRRFLSSTLDEMTFLFDARHLSTNLIQTKTPTPRSSFLVVTNDGLSLQIEWLLRFKFLYIIYCPTFGPLKPPIHWPFDNHPGIFHHDFRLPSLTDTESQRHFDHECETVAGHRRCRWSRLHCATTVRGVSSTRRGDPRGV